MANKSKTSQPQEQDEATTKAQEKSRNSENSARQAETQAEEDTTPSGKEVPARSARALGSESEGDAGPRPEVKGATAVSSARDSKDEKMAAGQQTFTGGHPRHSSNFGGDTGRSTGDHPYPRTATDTTVAGPPESVYDNAPDGEGREANHGANEANFGRALAKKHDGGVGQDVNPYGMAPLGEDEDNGLTGGHNVSGLATERYMTARRMARTTQSASPVVGEGAADNAKALLREMQDAILVGRTQGNDWWVHRFDSLAKFVDDHAEVEEEVEEEDETGATTKTATGRTISKKTAAARQTQTVKQAESTAKKDQKAAEKAVETAEDKLEEAEGKEDKAAARAELKDAKAALAEAKKNGKASIREAEKAAKSK